LSSLEAHDEAILKTSIAQAAATTALVDATAGMMCFTTPWVKRYVTPRIPTYIHTYKKGHGNKKKENKSSTKRNKEEEKEEKINNGKAGGSNEKKERKTGRPESSYHNDTVHHR